MRELTSRVWGFTQRRVWLTLLLMCGLVLVFLQLGPALRWPVRLVLLWLGAGVAVVLGKKIVTVARAPKRFLFGAAALLIGLGAAYLLLETICWAALRANPQQGQNPYVLTPLQREKIEELIEDGFDCSSFSPTLGWGVKANGVSPDGLYRANAQGFRGNRGYTAETPAGVTRALCFGDSFTYCHEVGNEETWEHYGEEAGGGKWEFLNFGVGGYGMAQTYLRFKEVIEEFETDFVVIGCMSNDIIRTPNVYYPFRHPHSPTTFALAKPYAALDEDNGELVIHSNPLPSLDAYREFLERPGERLREMAKLDIGFVEAPGTPLWTIWEQKMGARDFEWLERPADYVRDSLLAVADRKPVKKKRKRAKGNARETALWERYFEINTKLFKRFVKDVREAGAAPVILWYPSPNDVKAYNESGNRNYQDFLDFFEEQRFRYVDALDWIVEANEGVADLPVEEIFGAGHFSAGTNRMVGERMVKELSGITRNRDSGVSGSAPDPEHRISDR